MKYYNQYNYKNVPYWSAANPSATIATSGCGVCCASMVLSTFGVTVEPPAMAQIAQKIGARVNGGTDMPVLSNYLKKQYALNLSKTDNPDTLHAALEAGHIAVCNVGGDRTGHKGVFSNGGHYVIAYGFERGGPVVYDPGYYQNKYDSAYRSARVTVGVNHKLFCTMSTLNQDCANRTPRFYIFSKKAVEVVTAAEAIDVLAKAKEITNKAYWTKAVDVVKNVDALLIKYATYVENHK